MGVQPVMLPTGHRGSARPALSVVIPTYNEAESITSLLAGLAQHLGRAGITYEIIVVDDDSPDGSWRRAAEAAGGDERVRVIRRLGERGLAAAAVRGWQEAGGEILALMDGDLQHPPEVLVDLVRAVEAGASLAVASRYVAGGGVHRPTLARSAVSWLGAHLAACVAPGAARVRDPLSGYFAFRRDVVAGVPLAPRGYKILPEILARGRCGRVQEVPYTLQRRQRGRSKLTLWVYWESLRHLCRLARNSSGGPAGRGATG